MEIYRITPQGEDRLSYVSDFQLNFTTNSDSVIVNFKTAIGVQATFLMNGIVYFLYVHSDKPGYVYYDNKNFVIRNSDILEGRVMVYFPIGSTYESTTNVAGQFFVYSVNQAIIGIWTQITDMIYLIPDSDSNIVSKDCTPKCDGESCGQDSGCGLPCTCKEGKICSNGKCIDRPKPIIDRENNRCGQCPPGTTCTKTNNGYQCKWTLSPGVTTALIIIFILICTLVIMCLFIMVRMMLTHSDKSEIKYSYSENG